MTLSPTLLALTISSAFISVKETSVVREEERTISDTLKVLYRTGSEKVRIRLPLSRSRVKRLMDGGVLSRITSVAIRASILLMGRTLLMAGSWAVSVMRSLLKEMNVSLVPMANMIDLMASRSWSENLTTMMLPLVLSVVLVWRV